MPIGDLNTPGDLDTFVAERHSPTEARIRELSGLFQYGKGAPFGAPSGPRAVYLRMDGGTGSTFYVWDGVSWAAVA